jgi:HSP20 family molecular chaperone IbpA
MFERVFRLPTNMRVTAVTALLANGFLVVTLPKDSAVSNFSITIEY